MTILDFVIASATRILGRHVALVPDVSLGRTPVQRALSLGLGLMRWVVLLRRRIVLGHRARVRTTSKLRTAGGLIRIEEYCLIDCLSREGISVGRNFKLGAHSRMIATGSIANLGKGIAIGDNVGIGEFAHIGDAGGVVIGADCIIGPYLSVHPENHVFLDPDRLIRDQGVTWQGIEIGPGCWLGAKVTILDGARIGKGCVIAAGSAVTSSFPDRSVIGGVPARLIKFLDGKAKPELPVNWKYP